MDPSVEFSRPVRLDVLGTEPKGVTLEAQPQEREALARRFALLGIQALTAEARVTRSGEDVLARGTLKAAVEQPCVVTGESVPASVEEPFEIVFRPQPKGTGPEEEIELSEGELDVVFYDGAAIDLGEAVAESLALALDPYPRSPAAAEALANAGVKSEEEAGPFGALAALKDKLGG